MIFFRSLKLPISFSKIQKAICRNVLLFTAIIILVARPSFATTSRNLTVFAEPNMVLALTKITRLYSQKSNAVVSVNFNSSADLINNIDSGDPVDVFISGHFGLIEALHQKGLVDIYNSAYIASDNLVLVTPKSNQRVPEELRNEKISFEDALTILNRNKSSLVIDFNGNSSGKFSNDLLTNLSFAEIKVIHKSPEDKSPITKLIKNNNENYGLVLASQVNNEPNLQILATQKNNKIFYQALIIAGDNMEIAREFLKFLKSDAAKKILEQSGFTVN